ncbi:hypothetical protein ACRALDRAFT_2018273 [Sodiomyces alcalophilus JCM 7366]|uniref:uncharacterized protein n=1 Tax=Sodiomyces alcalophilus JCM 7366 TaxID=591952 RepID=UPI0039B66839
MYTDRIEPETFYKNTYWFEFSPYVHRPKLRTPTSSPTMLFLPVLRTSFFSIPSLTKPTEIQHITMDGEPDEDLLRQLASGNSIDDATRLVRLATWSPLTSRLSSTRWPALLDGILARLDKIALNDFPIPNLPPPRQPVNPLDQAQREPASPGNQPSSQEADKENNQPSSAPSTTATPKPDSDAPPPDAPPPDAAPPATAPDPTSSTSSAPGTLPPQIQDMLTEINKVLRNHFSKHPPHTVQRLAELILEPRRHYRHLAPYLHAVDRVIHVTSGGNVYPLPPAIPDMSSMSLLSNGVSNPAAAVAWGNPTSTAPTSIGSDEALGGALLTPIPWLTRRPSSHGDSASSSPASTHSAGHQPQQGQHEIRTESTETIEGPNGMGSIETVSVSTNGAHSTGAVATGGAGVGTDNTALRPITQGELLRQEQQRGVVPVNQLARQAEEIASHHAQAAAAAIAAARRSAAGGAHAHGDAATDSTTGTTASSPGGGQPAEEGENKDENEVPHARGPEAIGVNDLGPQSESTMRYVGGAGGPAVEMQGIDVEAAVGRKPDAVRIPTPAGTTGQADDVSKEGQTQESSTSRAEGEDAVSDAESETSHKRDAGEEPQGSPAAKKVRDEGADADGDETMKGTTEGARDGGEAVEGT